MFHNSIEKSDLGQWYSSQQHWLGSWFKQSLGSVSLSVTQCHFSKSTLSSRRHRKEHLFNCWYQVQIVQNLGQQLFSVPELYTFVSNCSWLWLRLSCEVISVYLLIIYFHCRQVEVSVVVHSALFLLHHSSPASCLHPFLTTGLTEENGDGKKGIPKIIVTLSN